MPGPAAVSPQVNSLYQVTKTLDTADGACDGDCSLREALIAANADPGSTIRVPAGVYSLTIPAGGVDSAAEGDLDISADVTLVGDDSPEIRSTSGYRVFHIHAGSTVVRQFKLGGSSSSSGGAIRIEESASLSLDDSTVTGSQAGLYGGGIYNNGNLTVRGSTISYNSTELDGGGIYNLSGKLIIENSTVSGNRANRHGGGIYTWDVEGGQHTATLASATIAGNTADADHNSSGAGGGLYQATPASAVGMKNSILANNSAAAAADCLAPSIQSFDYNLIETPSGCQLTGAVSHNLLRVDPGLEPLADNGGYTPTYLPGGPVSAVVDAGNPLGCTNAQGLSLTIDQRGEPRSQDGNGDTLAACDIGAAERAPMAPAAVLSLSKSLVSTNQAHTSGSRVAIGEMAIMTITTEIAPGRLSGASIVDVLDRGLAFVGCDAWSASPGLATNLPGGFSAACANPSLASEPPGSADPADRGRATTLVLGDVANLGTTPATLIFRVQVVVLDIPENQQGISLNSQVSLHWSNAIARADSASLEIVEPVFSLQVSTPYPAVPVGVPADIQLKIKLVGSLAAFEATLTNPLPAHYQIEPDSLQCVSGQAPDSLVYNPGRREITAYWARLEGSGAEITIAYRGALGNLAPGEETVDRAELVYSSLPGTAPAPLTPNNLFSTERDSYRLESAVSLSRVLLPDTGFAPGRVTLLPFQTEDSAYLRIDDIRLEIPLLDVDIPIVGVPLGSEGWDMTWLSDQAGYLEGTAYPTWDGNSVLTAHNYQASGLPGPFWNLGSLKWGDRLIVHIYGQRYIYEVRQVSLVLPGDLSPMRPETRPWLTLLTCRGYQEESRSYQYRVAVRAVLVKIE